MPKQVVRKIAAKGVKVGGFTIERKTKSAPTKLVNKLGRADTQTLLTNKKVTKITKK